MGTRLYLIGQGYDNLKKHGGKTFSTMLIICATMVIITLFIVAYVNIKTNAKVITENQGLKAYISDEVPEADIAKIGESIKNISNVKSITYLDKAAALQDAKETLKEYAYLLDGYEASNPFPRSFIVIFETLKSTEDVKEAVESVEGIYKVAYNDVIINAVISISEIGGIVIIALGAGMLLISVFIISNTIKLSVYSNKREIYIMKYIGATSKFIRYPFVVSGILMGLGSALFVWVVTSLGYTLLYSKAPQLNSQMGTFGLVPYSSFWWLVLVACVIIGIVLGGVGSSIAIKRYLRDFKPSKVAIKESKKRAKEEEKLQKRQGNSKTQVTQSEPVIEKQEQQEKETAVPKLKNRKQKSELEEAKELRRAGRKNVKKK